MRYWIRIVLILMGALLTVASAVLFVERRAPSTARLVAHSDFLSGNRDIHLRVPGSLHSTNLTNHPAIDSQPTWSPDGEWIAFVTDRETPQGRHPINNVYLMRRDGSDVRKLGIASPTTGTRTLIWSPDSQWLYVKYVMQGWWDNYIVRIADGHSITLRFNNTFTVLSRWSPRESVLAYQTNIPGSANDNETSFERVLPGDSTQPNIRSQYVVNELMYDFAWSADGQWIAAAGFSNPTLDEHMLARSRPNGDDFQILHTKPLPYGDTQWSPDGQWISFVAQGEDGDHVQLIRSDGTDDGAARQVTQTPGTYFTPSWSPDSRILVFAGFADDTGTIYQWTLTDDTLRPIHQSTAFIHHVNWNGQWIYFSSGNRGQAQLYQMRPDGSDITYLTDTAFEWELPVSPPISLSLKSHITFLAGLVLMLISIIPYPIGRCEPPKPATTRHFVLQHTD